MSVSLPTSGATLSYVNGSANWTTTASHFTSSNGNSVLTMPHGEDKVVLEKQATLDIKGSVRINGMDLDERLKTIETILCIPTRDVIMEEKYPKLKQIYEQYMHELEKYRTWERVKGDNYERTTS